MFAVLLCKFSLLAFERGLSDGKHWTCPQIAHLHGSYRTLRDGSFGGRYPRHFVPGYDHAVPLGRKRFRTEACSSKTGIAADYGVLPLS